MVAQKWCEYMKNIQSKECVYKQGELLLVFPIHYEGPIF